MASPKGYSAAQIALHWVVALMVLFQMVFGESMGMVWGAARRGLAPQIGLMVWAHIVVGSAVLAFALWRLILRRQRGVPQVPQGGSDMIRRAAGLGRWLLYAVMILAPMSGLAAWYGGIMQAAQLHQLLKPVIILLVAGHVVAALWHQFWLKDRLILRMMRPSD